VDRPALAARPAQALLRPREARASGSCAT
jgi:hypothetical protein